MCYYCCTEFICGNILEVPDSCSRQLVSAGRRESSFNFLPTVLFITCGGGWHVLFCGVKKCNERSRHGYAMADRSDRNENAPPRPMIHTTNRLINVIMYLRKSLAYKSSQMDFLRRAFRT